MAEASMAVYGAAIGVAIAVAIVTFVLRGKGHHEPIEEWKIVALIWYVQNVKSDFEQLYSMIFGVSKKALCRSCHCHVDSHEIFPEDTTMGNCKKHGRLCRMY